MKLRLRFILSNVLPLFIILPLMGLLVILALERLVFVPRLEAEIQGDLSLVTNILQLNPAVFESPSSAQTFIDRFAMQAPWRLMILSPDGVLLASSDPADESRLGSRLRRPELDQVLAGEGLVSTIHSQGMASEAIDAWSSARDASGRNLGVLRISQPLDTLGQDLMQMRNAVALIMIAGLLFGTTIGLGLAIGMERPLRTMTEALRRMAWETDPSPLEVQGPEEFTVLAGAFNHLTQRIQEMAATRKQLLANLVHELGRPLGALHSSIEALRQGADQDPELRDELLAGMDSQIRDTGRLLTDLTHLYQSSVGRLELERQPLRMDRWLRDALAPWKAHAQQRSIRLQAEIEQLPMLWIDPTRLGQAVGNLLSNAIKFTPRGGDIRLHSRAEGNWVSIQIDDSGPGLSVEDQQNLFTPFYRGQQDKRFPQGMGLGLSIARDIILSHNGVLEATPAPGTGTRFTIRLPIQSPQDPLVEA